VNGFSLLGLSVLVTASFAVEMAAGFGSMLVALSVGALFFSVNALLAVLLPLNICLSFFVVVSDFVCISWRLLLRRIIPLILIGMAVGFAWLHFAPPGLWIKFLLGIVIAGLAFMRLLVKKVALPFLLERMLLLTAGIVHALFATGGPLVVTALAGNEIDKSSFRATLALLWLLLNLLVLPRLVADGSLFIGSLWTSAWLIPATALGMTFGQRLHQTIPQERFAKSVSGLLVISGLVLSGKSLLEAFT
jgi:uncharacterized protein